MKGYRSFYLFIMLFVMWLIPHCHAQDYLWWEVKHNWDGVSPWSDYLIYSPGYMGPNALPVPDIRNGSVVPESEIELSFEAHFGRGDYTRDLFIRLNLPLFSKRVCLELTMVPYEYYIMDTATRDLRRARDYDGRGKSVGDVYVNTLIQLVKDHRFLPDILVSANLRTASGNNLSAARFTDSPGYFFDLSVGRDFRFRGNQDIIIRPYLLTGFYVWQTNRTDYFQDDAYMYGAGFDIKLSWIKLTAACGGYSGYIGNGDMPMVLRVSSVYLLKSKINLKLQFQYGIRDFNYTSIKAGFVLPLGSLIDKIPKSL